VPAPIAVDAPEEEAVLGQAQASFRHSSSRKLSSPSCQGLAWHRESGAGTHFSRLGPESEDAFGPQDLEVSLAEVRAAPDESSLRIICTTSPVDNLHFPSICTCLIV
jgi:hypothetical protein